MGAKRNYFIMIFSVAIVVFSMYLTLKNETKNNILEELLKPYGYYYLNESYEQLILIRFETPNESEIKKSIIGTYINYDTYDNYNTNANKKIRETSGELLLELNDESIEISDTSGLHSIFNGIHKIEYKDNELTLENTSGSKFIFNRNTEDQWDNIHKDFKTKVAKNMNINIDDLETILVDQKEFSEQNDIEKKKKEMNNIIEKEKRVLNDRIDEIENKINKNLDYLDRIISMFKNNQILVENDIERYATNTNETDSTICNNSTENADENEGIEPKIGDYDIHSNLIIIGDNIKDLFKEAENTIIDTNEQIDYSRDVVYEYIDMDDESVESGYEPIVGKEFTDDMLTYINGLDTKAKNKANDLLLIHDSFKSELDHYINQCSDN